MSSRRIHGSELHAVVEVATRCPLDALPSTVAADVADALRAIASLPTPTPADRRLAARLSQAAELIAPTVPPVGAG